MTIELLDRPVSAPSNVHRPAAGHASQDTIGEQSVHAAMSVGKSNRNQIWWIQASNFISGRVKMNILQFVNEELTEYKMTKWSSFMPSLTSLAL